MEKRQKKEFCLDFSVFDTGRVVIRLRKTSVRKNTKPYLLNVACQRANYGETVAETHVYSRNSGTSCLFLEVLYSPHIIVA